MSEQECEMSLKKTTNNTIFKKRSKANQFLTEKSLFESIQSNKKASNDVKIETEKQRKHRYKQLEFYQKGSSKGTNMYVDQKKSDQQEHEITIIPETDTEGEGEGKNQIPNRKMDTMAERFHPKVVLKDIINLCYDSDNA